MTCPALLMLALPLHTLTLHLRILPCARSSAPRVVMSAQAPQTAASLLTGADGRGRARTGVSGFPRKRATTATFWPEPGLPGPSLSWSKRRRVSTGRTGQVATGKAEPVNFPTVSVAPGPCAPRSRIPIPSPLLLFHRVSFSHELLMRFLPRFSSVYLLIYWEY